MKKIELDDELYQYIAGQTQDIGESASQILRRLLNFPAQGSSNANPAPSSSASSAITSESEALETSAVNDSEDDAHIADTNLDYDDLLAFLNSEQLANTELSVERFLLILSRMYQDSSEQFATASETVKGRKRLYLADSEAALEEGGKTCKPRAIPNSPFWVITNANTGRKRIIIAQLMASMGYAHQVIEKACEKI
ncbi:replication initiation negative regulator SeqA [Motilimonas pumila]|uniref:Negative modulator of initiation of replication n=1 Tax=Motilimonas pumila TaxID=2303987 RepID=A0A418YEY7_9GAMM|nr:replication initiation negative regulator SeqA [Motilimonas pumila]RJG47712.1 replication initiation negative regulator SeqA [Motilimonas pumila]